MTGNSAPPRRTGRGSRTAAREVARSLSPARSTGARAPTHQPEQDADQPRCRRPPSRSSERTCDRRPADRLQDPELAPPVGDRDRQRVHDAEDRDEDGDDHLRAGHAEPLVGQPRDVVAHFARWRARRSGGCRRSARGSAPSPPPGPRRGARKTRKKSRCRRSSVSGEHREVDDQRPLLIASNRERCRRAAAGADPTAYGSSTVSPTRSVLQRREVLRADRPLARPPSAGTSRRGRRRSAVRGDRRPTLATSVDMSSERLLPDLDAWLPHALHLGDPSIAFELGGHRLGEPVVAPGQRRRRGDEEVGVERRVHPFGDVR